MIDDTFRTVMIEREEWELINDLFRRLLSARRVKKLTDL
jgi:hypothetical protein